MDRSRIHVTAKRPPASTATSGSRAVVSTGIHDDRSAETGAVWIEPLRIDGGLRARSTWLSQTTTSSARAGDGNARIELPTGGIRVDEQLAGERSAVRPEQPQEDVLLVQSGPLPDHREPALAVQRDRRLILVARSHCVHEELGSEEAALGIQAAGQNIVGPPGGRVIAGPDDDGASGGAGGDGGILLVPGGPDIDLHLLRLGKHLDRDNKQTYQKDSAHWVFPPFLIKSHGILRPLRAVRRPID